MSHQVGQVCVAIGGMAPCQILPFHDDIWGVEMHDRVDRRGAEQAARPFQKLKKPLRVFSDMKLFDTPETVTRRMEPHVQAGVDLITVHATGETKMLRAAMEAAKGSKTKVLAVIRLTSQSPDTQVVTKNLDFAAEAGVDGIVIPVPYIEIFKLLHGGTSWDPLIVAAGIRREEDPVHEHKMTGTPKQAGFWGVHLLVIGRPITRAIDKSAALRNIRCEIVEGMCEGGHHVTAVA